MGIVDGFYDEIHGWIGEPMKSHEDNLLSELADIRGILLNDEQGTDIYEKWLGPCVNSPFEISGLAKARMEERNKYREALKKIADYSPDMNGFVGPVARSALNQV